MKANFDNRINQLRNDIKNKIVMLLDEDVDTHIIFTNESSGVVIPTDNGEREIAAVLWNKKKSVELTTWDPYEVRYDFGQRSFYVPLCELSTDTLNALYKALYKELNGEEEG